MTYERPTYRHEPPSAAVKEVPSYVFTPIPADQALYLAALQRYNQVSPDQPEEEIHHQLVANTEMLIGTASFPVTLALVQAAEQGQLVQPEDESILNPLVAAARHNFRIRVLGESEQFETVLKSLSAHLQELPASSHRLMLKMSAMNELNKITTEALALQQDIEIQPPIAGREDKRVDRLVILGGKTENFEKIIAHLEAQG